MPASAPSSAVTGQCGLRYLCFFAVLDAVLSFPALLMTRFFAAAAAARVGRPRRGFTRNRFAAFAVELAVDFFCCLLVIEEGRVGATRGRGETCGLAAALPAVLLCGGAAAAAAAARILAAAARILAAAVSGFAGRVGAAAGRAALCDLLDPCVGRGGCVGGRPRPLAAGDGFSGRVLALCDGRWTGGAAVGLRAAVSTGRWGGDVGTFAATDRDEVVARPGGADLGAAAAFLATWGTVVAAGTARRAFAACRAAAAARLSSSSCRHAVASVFASSFKAAACARSCAAAAFSSGVAMSGSDELRKSTGCMKRLRTGGASSTTYDGGKRGCGGGEAAEVPAAAAVAAGAALLPGAFPATARGGEEGRRLWERRDEAGGGWRRPLRTAAAVAADADAFRATGALWLAPPLCGALAREAQKRRSIVRRHTADE